MNDKLRLTLVLACLGLAIGWAGAARGAVFDVNPVKIVLSPGKTSQLLTLRSREHSPIRFQLSVFSWQEQPDGQMQLEPSSEVVVYPTLLELQPHEQRKIRLGTLNLPSGGEQSYRLIVEELPGSAARPTAPNTVYVRTRLSIPVFVRSQRPQPKLSISRLALDDGAALLDLQNLGNAHLRVRTIELTGSDGSGEAVFEQQLKGWYLLQNGLRSYRLQVPPEVRCSLWRLDVLVESSAGDAQLSRPVAHGDCGR